MAEKRQQVKITQWMYNELKIEQKKTKIPMLYLMEKAWRAYIEKYYPEMGE